MSVIAFEQAIAFLSRTDLIASARQQPLPAGVTEILKVSSGDTEALLAAQESSRFSQEDVRHAAQFYVQQILFAPESDHYRVLGVDPDDVEAKIKLHYRLLVRWLHPDKNSSDWEAVFSDRINRAWHALRTPDRRREYDAQLESYGRPPQEVFANHRELKPTQWHHHKADERFLSSRAIKRLPVVMFCLLGVAALSALWWFSQLQPRVDVPLIANVETNPQHIEPSTTADVPALIVEDVVAPMEPVIPIAESAQKAVTQIDQETINPDAGRLNQAIAPVDVLEIKSSARQSAGIPQSKKPIPVPDKAGLEPLAVTAVKPAVENRPVVKLVPPIASNEIKAANSTATKSRESVQKPQDVAVVAVPAIMKPEMPVIVSSNRAGAKPDVIAANRHDAEVKKLLQKFSSVYADGNYFALHNLFTTDLSVIGAPSQRKVLHGYRRLFQTSQYREIALQNVTWLESDEKITVVANFKSEVLPMDGSEAQSSQGNIRLLLRMENGELKIMRLQSDTKNG